MRALAAFAFLAAVLFASGCDLFGDPVRYRGTVVDATSGEPIEGLYMSIREAGGLAGPFLLTSTFTDARGRFEIRYGRGGSLYANVVAAGAEERFFDPRYTDALTRGESYSDTTRLPRRAARNGE